MAEPNVVEAVLAYVNAATWEEKKQLLRSRRDELFVEEADAILGRFVDQYKNAGDEEAVNQLRMYREVLWRARHEGVDAAFVPLEIDEDASTLVREFLEENDYSKLKELILARGDELRSPPAAAVLDLYQLRFRDDSKTIEHVGHYRELLARSARDGVDAVFDDLVVEIPEPVMTAMSMLIDAKTWGEALDVVERNRNLLFTPQAEKTFDFFASIAREHDDDTSRAMLARVVHVRHFLARCKLEGTDTVRNDLQKVEKPAGEYKSTDDEVTDADRRLNALMSEIAEANHGVVSQRQVEELVLGDPELAQAWRRVRRGSATSFVTLSDSHRGEIAAALGELLALDPDADSARRAELSQRALQYVSRDAMPELWATLQHSLAAALSRSTGPTRADDVERSIEHHRLGFEALPREQSPEAWAGAKVDMGNAYINRTMGSRAENVDTALRCWREALEVLTLENDSQAWAGAHSNLATAYAMRPTGDPEENSREALLHAEQALRVLDAGTYPLQWADIQIAMANAYRHAVGDRAVNYERSIEAYRKAIGVHSRDRSPERWAMIQCNLGLTFAERSSGDPAENAVQARLHCLNALEVFTRDARPTDWASLHVNLAAVLLQHSRSAEDIDDAIRSLKLAAEVLTNDQHPADWAKVVFNTAAAYRQRRAGDSRENLAEAMKLYREALTVYRRDTFPHRWGLIHKALGEIAWSTPEENWLDRAREHFELALDVFSTVGVDDDRATVMSELADTYFGEERWLEAHEKFGTSIEAAERSMSAAVTDATQRQVIESVSDAYANDAYCLLRLGAVDRALERLEQGKARALADVLRITGADLDHLSPDDREAILRTRSNLRALETEFRDWTEASPRVLTDVGSELESARAVLNALFARQQTIDPDFATPAAAVEEIVAAIPNGGALVAPIVTRMGGAVIIVPAGTNAITADNLLDLPGCDANWIMRLLHGSSGYLSAYEAHILGGSLTDWQRAIDDVTSALWMTMVGPIAARLGSVGIGEGQSVLLLLPGRLAVLPIHAAWRVDDGRRRYLIDDYVVSYAPSARAVAKARQNRGTSATDSTLLAIVDPTGDLRYAAEEGRYVAELFEPNRREVLEAGEATRDAVLRQSGGKTHLHFAGHGQHVWDDPTRSCLVLADGPLRLRDILSPALDVAGAELVTLSACETGLTDVLSVPDEFVGLPGAFLRAGARAVMSSLWPVEDQSTSMLMQEFYRRLIADGQPAPAALAAAQRWLRSAAGSRYEAPYYWAAFTINGAG